MPVRDPDKPIVRLRPAEPDPVEAEVVDPGQPPEVDAPGARIVPSPGHRRDAADGDAAARISTLVNKGIQLAEAVVDLGIRVVDSVGLVTQRLVNDRLNAPPNIPLSALRGAPWSGPAAAAAGAPMYPSGQAVPPAPAGPTPPSGASEPAPAAGGFEAFHVVNRLPLVPGSPVMVSLSLSNDSPSAPSRVALELRGFTGQERGAVLDARGFAVVPPESQIAPLDFEKFSIRGVIPGDAPPDVYAGWIVVSGDEELQIPIRLIVAVPGSGLPVTEHSPGGRP